MGVWHLSGLGMNPGAITVPLTYIYLLLKQASQGESKAVEFFGRSGESREKMKGKPQAVIVFTSEDVINGKKQSEIEDKWFKTQKRKSALETISAYLAKLLNELKSDDFPTFYNGKWIEYFYCVKVDYQDFDDCFRKIAVTVNALRDKEIWINMIGGANPINAALLSSSGFTSTASVYYYLFQTNIKLLHPDIKKPNFNNLRVPVPPPSWHELPFFTLDMSPLYNKLTDIFKYKEKANENEIKKLLKELNFPDQFFAKLKGRLLKIDGEIVTKGYMLDYWAEMWNELRNEFDKIKNFTDWKNWALKEGILKEIEPF
jgi:hypothetical protein